MADFKNLIALITKAIDSFTASIPGLQKQMLSEVINLARRLDVKGNDIRINAANLKLIADIKGKLQRIILNPEYVKSVKDYVGKFNDITKLQNQYFNSVTENFSPPDFTKEILKIAKESVVNKLTESGLDANVTEGVKDILRKAITGGSSYATLQDQLTNYLVDNGSGEGQLNKYTKQISTDALNQFSGQYTQLISSDLGYEWFRYSGSNIVTTRAYCLACTDRKYFHISELPEVLKGEFDEFKKYDGKIYDKTGLPQGMIPGTDVSNFMVNRGGYNCGHQWRPVSEDLVPKTIKDRVYASFEYKAWKGVD